MKCELLAPAGSRDSFYSAIYYGADAVYLGLDRFNARIKAANFDIDSLPQDVEYAHSFGVRVYLTVNISIKEDELAAAVALIRQAYEAKIDAVIVTDIGLICKLREELPKLSLHFSTQMGVHNALGAKQAEKLSAKRIIISRETTLEDIKQIRSETNLEIEAFAHGALCVSFSGGCLMSSYIGGNSGNRGLCMQPCRQKYKAVSGGKTLREDYLLSTSDLCAVDKIKSLENAGICSLKIEGRLRRAEYVGQTIKTYRKALDGEKITECDKKQLKTVYNRGDFTEGYYFNSVTSDIMSPLVQGHKGVYAGQAGGGKKFLEGDGFKVIRAGREVGSAVWQNGELRFSTRDIVKTDELYITSDARQLGELRPQIKKHKITMSFTARQNCPAQLHLYMGHHHVFVLSADKTAEAVTAPLTREGVSKQLLKLNNTMFFCEDIKIDIDDNIFINNTELNNLRRKAVDMLKNALILEYYDRQSSL